MADLIGNERLDADELGRVLVTLDAFVASGLISETTATRLLSDRIWSYE